ncbi:MAG: twin-arginine translocase TatA/TatE family subunit [Pseudomonadota bacterium]
MKFGIWELLILLALVVMIFGTKRFRNAGGDIGAAIKGFKKEMGDADSKKNDAKDS